MKRNDIRNSIARAILALTLIFSCNHAWGKDFQYSGNCYAGAYFDGDNITITGNTTLFRPFVIIPGATVTIDLNGYTVNCANGTRNTRVFVVSGTLIIKDSKGTGKFYNGLANRGGFALVQNGGVVNFQSGTVQNCNGYYTGSNSNEEAAGSASLPYIQDTSYGLGSYGCGAFYIANGGTVNMSGSAKIINCHTYYTGASYTFGSADVYGHGGAVFVDGGTFKMTGGTISDCNASDGGAVYVNSGTFNLQGGTISKCRARTTSGETYPNDSNGKGYRNNGGGAVSVNQNGTFAMSGGTIDQCYTEPSCYGAGVFNRGTFNMSGGTISNCVPYAFLTQEGATKSINYRLPAVINGATHYMYGGGVYVNLGGKFNMTGGTIKGCVGISGGGVFLWGGISNLTPELILNGGTITDNYAIGVDYSNGGGVFVQNSKMTFSKGTISYNKAGRYGGAINIDQGSTLNLVGDAGTCLIDGNIASYGGGVSQESGECAMTIGSSNVKIINNKATGVWSDVINTAPEGSTAVYGTKGIGHGGGVFIEKGTLNISNGLIQDNEATGGGGGISFRMSRVTGNITANITGGQILGNKATYTGSDSRLGKGGAMEIYADRAASVKNAVNVKMTKGTMQGNSARKGGGISITIAPSNSTAQVTIGGTGAGEIPEIKENSVSVNGGGIDMYYGSVTVNNGLFSKNTANSSGGAIAQEQGSINVNNGTFKENSAVRGGALYVNVGTFNVAKGLFSNNGTVNNAATAKQGGAVYLATGTVNITDNVTFTENTVTEDGGAVYVAGGDFNVTGETTISKNSASNGGGICVSDGSVEIKSGLISENTSTFLGGGLYVVNSTATEKSIVFSGGRFVDNDAMSGGGICASGNKSNSAGRLKLTISASVEQNTAVNGGGIYLMNYADMTFGNGLIRGNRAITDEPDLTITSAYSDKGVGQNHGVGGGIYLNNNTTLKFNSTDMGLYNNKADIAADELFASGVGTSVTLPAILNMNLKDYDVPVSKLFWQEDYVNGDIYYNSHGTNQAATKDDVFRYQYALRNALPTFHMPDSKINTPLSEYICLALGFDMVYVKLIKKGLQKNEGAIIKIYSHVDESAAGKHFSDVVLSSVDGGDVVRFVALPAGRYSFVEESAWSWHYNNGNAPTIKYSDSETTASNGSIEVSQSLNKVVTVTNVVENEDVRHDEDRATNILKR